MKKYNERKQRVSLTLFFVGMVLAFQFVTMLLITVIVVILAHVGVLKSGEGMNLDAFIGIVALSSIPMGAALAATVGRIPLRAVNKLINCMNRLAGGDFTARLNYNGPLEKAAFIREVSQSFNKMASELESTEMLRSDFINNFSHEFKTPIVSIAGFAKLLKKGNLSEEEQREYLNIIENESLRLSTMATNVLNMTRVENQTILSDVTEYNLSEQLRNCVLLLERKWSGKRLEMNVDLDEHMICGSEELLKQVWVNLLDNAIKFTPENGIVEITVAEKEENILVSVKNTGSEIPEASREKIFHKFYQAEESHATEGNGIGLAIVDKAVKLHGGHAEAESGNGWTEFRVSLPKRTIGEYAAS